MGSIAPWLEKASEVSGDLSRDLRDGKRVALFRYEPCIEVRALGERNDRVLRFVCATEGMKRDGYNVRIGDVGKGDEYGFDFTEFRKNPVMLWCHDYGSAERPPLPPIGRWVNWFIDIVGGKRALVMDAKFARTSLAEELYRLYLPEKDGGDECLRAVSIGWTPDKYEEILGERGEFKGWDMLVNTLFECSGCPIGKDSDALLHAAQGNLLPSGNRLSDDLREHLADWGKLPRLLHGRAYVLSSRESERPNGDDEPTTSGEPAVTEVSVESEKAPEPAAPPADGPAEEPPGEETAAKEKTQKQVDYLLSDGSPLSEDEKAKLKQELHDGTVKIVGSDAPAESRAEAGSWKCGADRELPMSDSNEWDGAAAKSNVFAWAGFDGDSPDASKAKRAFLVYDADNANLKGSYKLPFADVRGGKLVAVMAGLRAAASRLPQTDAPQDVLDRARGVLDSYFEKAKKAAAGAGFTRSELSDATDVGVARIKAACGATCQPLCELEQALMPLYYDDQPPTGDEAQDALLAGWKAGDVARGLRALTVLEALLSDAADAAAELHSVLSAQDVGNPYLAPEATMQPAPMGMAATERIGKKIAGSNVNELKAGMSKAKDAMGLMQEAHDHMKKVMDYAGEMDGGAANADMASSADDPLARVLADSDALRAALAPEPEPTLEDIAEAVFAADDKESRDVATDDAVFRSYADAIFGDAS